MLSSGQGNYYDNIDGVIIAVKYSKTEGATNITMTRKTVSKGESYNSIFIFCNITSFV